MPVRKTEDLKVQLQITVKQASVHETRVYSVSDCLHFTHSWILDKWFVQNTICNCCEL